MEKCDEKILWLDYKNITKVVQVGSHVYVDDGLITLTVKEIGERTKLRLSSVLALSRSGRPFTGFTGLCLQAATT